METKSLLWVGGARNQHGTRIARWVKCQKCGQEDHITSRPSKTSGAFCRLCAKQEMNAIEVGHKAPKDMKTHMCSQCGKDFELPARMQPQKGCVCSSCLRGFDTWRGSLEMAPETRETMQLEKRSSGVLIRRK